MQSLNSEGSDGDQARKYQLYIGGEWVDAASDERARGGQPGATEETIGQVPQASVLDVDRAIAAARHAFPRSCVRETQVGRAVLHEGQRVIMGTACANRDEAVFVNRDDFDIDRANRSDHLTFGYGPHFCPGAPQARAVARIGITTFPQHFPKGTSRLADGFVYENVPRFFETGSAHLTVGIRR